MSTEIELQELDVKIAHAKGYSVSWWSIHPWKDWDGHMTMPPNGMVQPHEEVLLPDDRGDMPVLQMLADGAWVMVKKWSSDWTACRELMEEMRKLGIRITIEYLQPTHSALPASCQISVRNEIRSKWDKAEQFKGETIEECVARCYLAYQEKVHGRVEERA